MKFSLSDLKMRTKLLLLASIGILGLVVIGTLSTLDLKQANRDLAQINSSIQTVTNFGEMKSRLLMARLNLVYMMALTDMTRISDRRRRKDSFIADTSLNMETNAPRPFFRQ